MKKDFLILHDLTKEALIEMVDLAIILKAELKKNVYRNDLKNKILAMVFEKPSTRTRVSFEVAMLQLGGHAITIDQKSSQLGRGETYADTARVLSSYCDAILCRTSDQRILEEMATASHVPVINGLSDQYHPVQLLADLLTAKENNLDLNSMKVCYAGDFNNLSRSWINAAEILEFQLNISCPNSPKDLSKNKNIQVFEDPSEAVQGMDIIYTDTWVSMNMKNEQSSDLEIFKKYQLNSALLKLAEQAIVMHCLPAHRGDEITDEVMDGAQSRIFPQAENRLHAQKALLIKLMNSK